MRQMLRGLLCLSSLLFSAEALAHHSSAMYDTQHKVLIEGTVTQFQWVNPHSWLWLDVPNDKGGADAYALECGSIAQLLEIGWTRQKVKVGDHVKIVGALRKDGVKRGEVFTLVTAGGETLRNRVGY